MALDVEGIVRGLREISQRERPLVKTSNARAMGAFTRTVLRTGAITVVAFIHLLLGGFPLHL
jgi:hypothetical protein